MKVCKHLKVARWRFVLFYTHVSLSYSSLGAKTCCETMLYLPLYHMAGGSVTLASGQKYQT